MMVITRVVSVTLQGVSCRVAAEVPLAGRRQVAEGSCAGVFIPFFAALGRELKVEESAATAELDWYSPPPTSALQRRVQAGFSTGRHPPQRRAVGSGPAP